MVVQTEFQTRAAVDDIEIIPDPPQAPSRGRWNWVVPLLPWAWFAIRGLHPVFEVVAILLPLLAVGAIVAALLSTAFWRSKVIGALALSLVLFSAVAIVGPRRPASVPAPVDPARIASINLAGQWFVDNEVGYFTIAQEPDIFVGTELREPVDAELRDRFSYAVSDLADNGAAPEAAGTYRENGFPSIGIYSNYEMTELPDPIAEFPGGLPGFRVQVMTENGEVIVYALHIPRPGTGSGLYDIDVRDQRQMVDAISEAIHEESLPVVVIGDLNLVDRGGSFAAMSEGLNDGMRSNRWADSTRLGGGLAGLLQLRIDHLLVTPDLCTANAETPRYLYTDHAPILADFGPCPRSDG